MSSPDRCSLSYSRVEIESYLPSGWSLVEPQGIYEPKQRSWQVPVEDVSELTLTLVVDQNAVDKVGRIPALQAAIDRLVRRV